MDSLSSTPDQYIAIYKVFNNDISHLLSADQIDLYDTDNMEFRIFKGSEFAEHMGYALASTDLNRDGNPDIVIGSQQAKNGSLSLAGRIRILRGKGGDLSRDDVQRRILSTV